MQPRAFRGLAGALAVLALAGCSVFHGIRRDPPPGPVPAASVQAAAPPPRPFRLRSAAAPVPAGYRQTTLEFADALHGAALFTKCRVPKRAVGTHNDCAAVVLVTADGGVSWQARRHPEPVADGQQLHVGVDGTIVLLSEPYAYFVSTDRGATFQKFPYGSGTPVAYRALAGPYEICCDTAPGPTLRRADQGRETPAPVAPPIGGRLGAVVERPGRDLWVASIAPGGLVTTAVSADGGGSWREVAVPGAFAASVQLLTAAGDLWLLADGERPLFPSVWRLAAGSWQPLTVPDAPTTYRSAAALGSGLLAVSGSSGTGVINARGAYLPTDWPARGLLTPLGDGGLQLRDDVTGTFWLGAGAGPEWRWVELDLRT